MYRGSCVKSYPKNELEVIDKSYANHKRRSGTNNHLSSKIDHAKTFQGPNIG